MRHTIWVQIRQMTSYPEKKCCFITAKLQLLKLIHLFAREVLVVEMLEIAETKTT